MKNIKNSFIFLAVLFLLNTTPGVGYGEIPIPESEISIEVYQRVGPKVLQAMKLKGLELGSPIFVRIFKEEGELEVWVEKGLSYKLFKIYTICNFSGELGPKLVEGDYQSPEGFYNVGPDRLNPWSDYHLSFNIGFPNEFDQSFERTGSALMVHGHCSSMGCFAMTDFRMEEIYTIAASAIQAGQQQFPMHIFPFRMTWENMARHSGNKWMTFWENLKQGYDYFQGFRAPPVVIVEDRRYVFQTFPQRLFGGTMQNPSLKGLHAKRRKTTENTGSF